MLKQVFMLTSTVSIFAFKNKPAIQKSCPSNKHTEAFYIQALSHVEKVLESKLHEVRWGTGAIFSEMNGRAEIVGRK